MFLLVPRLVTFWLRGKQKHFDLLYIYMLLFLLPSLSDSVGVLLYVAGMLLLCCCFWYAAVAAAVAMLLLRIWYVVVMLHAALLLCCCAVVAFR